MQRQAGLHGAREANWFALIVAGSEKSDGKDPFKSFECLEICDDQDHRVFKIWEDHANYFKRFHLFRER